MKILHINTSDDPSGAYTSAWLLHLWCLDQGWDSKMLILNQNHGSKPNQYSYWEHISTHFIEKLSLFICARTLYKSSKLKEQELQKLGSSFHFAETPFRVHKHPLVKEADIIHLHQTSTFIDWPSFFKNIEKHIVFTFHDYEAISEGYHLKLDSEINSAHSKRNIEIKKRAIATQSNFKRVGISPSQFQFQRLSDLGLFENWEHRVIHHPVKVENTMSVSSKIDNLPDDYYVFIASDLNRKEKGYEQLIKSYSMLRDTEKFNLVCIGNAEEIEKREDVYYTGKISDRDKLYQIIKNAKGLIVVSEEESFGMIFFEGLALNKTIFTTPVGVANELKELSPSIFINSSVFELIMAVSRHNVTGRMNEENGTEILNTLNDTSQAHFKELYKSLVDKNKLK